MSVGRLVADNPRRARVFERLGIDYCCGGAAALDRVCRERGLDVAAVLGELAACAAGAQNNGYDRFEAARATLVELIEHIVATHHAFLRRELPRLSAMVGDVVRAHGGRHPELEELADVFDSLENEAVLHMLKEEKILFPIIARIETAAGMPEAYNHAISRPIALMESEHGETGAALARLRTLTGGHTPPGDACPTYVALLEGLAELEADLHRHIHEENNLLFPRARAAEDALQAAGSGSDRT
jgi:regulator of cell morphogenesis and NO signaling